MLAEVTGTLSRKSYYLHAVKLEDGTPVNVVTRWTGPGLGCDTELEAPRQLTTAEQEAASDAAALWDVAAGPVLKRATRYPVVASY